MSFGGNLLKTPQKTKTISIHKMAVIDSLRATLRTLGYMNNWDDEVNIDMDIPDNVKIVFNKGSKIATSKSGKGK